MNTKANKEMNQTQAEREAGYRERGWWTGEPLADRFHGHVVAGPERLSIVDERGASLSRQQLWDRAGETADLLAGAGVTSGDVVLVDLCNTTDWQVAFLGVQRLGGIAATLPTTTDAQTLAYMYAATGARSIIAHRYKGRNNIGEAAREAAVASGCRATVVIVEEDDSWKVENLQGTPVASVVPAGITHIMFTSSTTGMPKIVLHTDDTLAAANIGVIERFGIDEDTPIYMPSPLGHSVGAWHGSRFSLYTGAALVLQDKWDPIRGLELVDEYQCVFTAAATPFLNDIVNAEWDGGTKLQSLKTFICGGAPVPPVLMERAREQTPNTLATVLWGMTEGTGTTGTSYSTDEQLTQTAGKPLSGLELRIEDADENGVGELSIRGPQVLVGYLGQEALFQSLLTEDGFFRTGDLATIGEDGYLRLAGRLKDLIIRGGKNISPGPIEDAIAAHPSVLRVAVIGRSDERLGERICAVITVHGEAPTLEQLTDWLREQGLPQRKLPESLVVFDDMPVTAAGKIRKVDLTRMVEEQS